MPNARESLAGHAHPGPLLERTHHLAALEAHLATVRQYRRGRIVFVGGEAGVGKSALARSFCDSCTDSVRILMGVCDPLFTPRPLGPFLDIAPSLGGDFQALVERGARPYEVAAVLARTLATGPLMVVLVEDAQWADEASLDTLSLLARRMAAVGALTLVTYRDDLPRNHPLRILLGELPQDDTIARLRLAPLSLSAVETLAEPNGVDAKELYRKTSGNPFFVTEALAAGEDAIPPTVRDAVLARAARLPSDAFTLLESIAIVPQAIELWLLEQIAEGALEQIDICLASGILTESDGGVRFRHELARLAIEDSLTPIRRLTLHRRVLRALQSPPHGEPDAARLAHHAEAAGDVDAILRYAPVAAAQAALLGAHREASEHYKRALKVAQSLPPMERGELFACHSEESFLADDFPATAASGWEAVECFHQAGNQLREGVALSKLSHRLRCTGYAHDAAEVGARAVALLETLPVGRELAWAYASVASLKMNADEVEESRLFALRALALARESGNIEAEAHTLNTLGTLELLDGDQHGLDLLGQTLRLALDAGLEEQVGRAYVNHGWASTRSRSYADYERWFAAGREYCEERGLVLWEHYVVVYAARFALDRGRWNESAELAQRILRYPHPELPRVHALATVALIRARRGDPECWPLLDEARAVAEHAGELQHLALVAAAQAEVAWLEGRPDVVLAVTHSALALAVEKHAHWAIGELAVWRRRAGVEVGPTTGEAEPFASELAGQWEAAARIWESRGCPYDAAVARIGTQRESDLREAHSVLQGLGAHATARLVARRLREIGARDLPRGPRLSTRANDAHLTERELDVLALVAQGLRNAEIAHRLTLSPKTVDHHVSAILAKLGVRSRAQAITQAQVLHLLTADITATVSR